MSGRPSPSGPDEAVGAPPDADAITSKQPLDKGALMERLTISSPELVKELYETTLRQIQTETGRQARLDAKAMSLLAASGISSPLPWSLTTRSCPAASTA